MPSKNTFSADNQQERLEMPGWVVGFVDGEGSFLVTIFKSSQAKMKWQIFPEFNVSQSLKGKDLLHKLETFFGCGHIYAHNARNIKLSAINTCMVTMLQLTVLLFPNKQEIQSTKPLSL